MDRILVVDDEPDISNLAKIILEAAGYEVATACDGDDCFAKTTSEFPDLIILDIVMPGKSGLEVCKALKADHKTRLIPVVVFTVLSREADRKLIKDAEAEGYLPKPFDAKSLIVEVESRLTQSHREKFSRILGLDHTRMRNRKILFEFDPASQYERSVRDFALEALANGEAAVILSPSTSTLQRILQGEKGLDLIPITPQTVLSPVCKAHEREPLALVYDNLTDLALSTNFRYAYNFIKNAMEILNGSNSTALFLLNPEALYQNEVCSIRNLFSDQVAFGREGLTKVKLT